MSFADRLRQKRIESGLTQVQLAEMLGVTKGAIGNYETGISSMKAESLFKVCDILHCDPNFLFQDEMKIAPAKESQGLDEDESELLTLYRSVRAVSPDDAEIIIQYARCVDRIAGVGLSAARKQAELASDFYDALRQERRG